MEGLEAPTGSERTPLHRRMMLPRATPAIDRPVQAVLAGAAAVGLCGMPVVALVPLGPLSAHMAHHIALMSVLAPICAVALAPLVQDRIAWSRGAVLWIAAFLQIALLWAWHAPPLHAATMAGTAYAVMLATLLAAAVCFWGGILLLAPRSRWQAIVALLATGKLACLLGALLIFARRPLFVHATIHVDAHSLDDQQLAGLLMVVACPLSYVLVGVVLSAQLMHGIGAGAEQRARPRIAASWR
jgi:putative membrane protein